MKPGGAWTREDVEARLVAAFRALPQCPVFAQSRTITTVGHESNSVTDALNWSTLLASEPAARTYLWTWARCRARRESFGALCRGMGWPRTTAEDGRRRATRLLVHALNAPP